MTDDIVEKIVMKGKAAEEIRRLRKYEQLVRFIANDYHELSHDKVAWQRGDWYKRCRKLIEGDALDDPKDRFEDYNFGNLDF